MALQLEKIQPARSVENAVAKIGWRKSGIGAIALASSIWKTEKKLAFQDRGLEVLLKLLPSVHKTSLIFLMVSKMSGCSAYVAFGAKRSG